MNVGISTKAPDYLRAAAAGYALLGGLVSFLGWVTGIHRLTAWTGDGIAMKANAALAATLAAAALLAALVLPSGRWAVRALGAVVAAVGGLTLLEHLTGTSFGIDTLLFHEPPGAIATVAPGRMGPPASMSFLAIGTALVLLTHGARGRAMSVALALAVLAIGSLSLIGHWYGAELMYAVPRVTGIAAQTSTILVALAIGLVAACPDRDPMRTLCEDTPAGLLARRLVPLVVIVPMILGWLRVRGEEAGLFDAEFGTAIRSLLEAILLAVLLWWSLKAVRDQDLQRRHAERELKEADRRKDEFIATLAHELRNPLAPIGSAARVLLRRDLPEATLHWSAEVIDRQVQHMARLLEDLLDVSRISLKRFEFTQGAGGRCDGHTQRTRNEPSAHRCSRSRVDDRRGGTRDLGGR